MANTTCSDTIPIIVGAGQSLQALADTATVKAEDLQAPMDLAASACLNAISDAGLNSADKVDTIAVVRLFSDSTPVWSSPFGGSSNPPKSIARRISANPDHCIYGVKGGTQPQQLVAEMFQALARGEKSLVLLSGAEAIGNQKLAQKAGLTLDWNEEFEDSPNYEDRGCGGSFFADEEIANGVYLPIYGYSLIENARAHKEEFSKPQQLEAMATLFEHFSEIAVANPYAQFPKDYSVNELITPGPGNFRLSDPYTKRFVSQDGVNQGAALLLTTVGKARELGIDENNWIYLHGYAEGYDHYTYLRPDIGTSGAMDAVFRESLKMASMTTRDISLYDIYSCFPCAVSSACDSLDLAKDGSQPLTLTGGLPFFGGPGNNYSMHGLAEMMMKLRASPPSFGMVTANGGILSKHAAGIYSTAPSAADWTQLDIISFTNNDIPGKAPAKDPQYGRIVTYMMNISQEQLVQCSVVAETTGGDRFLACSSVPELLADVEFDSPIGKTIKVIEDSSSDNPLQNQFIFS